MTVAMIIDRTTNGQRFRIVLQYARTSSFEPGGSPATWLAVRSEGGLTAPPYSTQGVIASRRFDLGSRLFSTGSLASSSSMFVGQGVGHAGLSPSSISVRRGRDSVSMPRRARAD